MRLNLAHGLVLDQGFDHVDPTETEVPTYLQSDPSALLAQVEEYAPGHGDLLAFRFSQGF